MTLGTGPSPDRDNVVELDVYRTEPLPPWHHGRMADLHDGQRLYARPEELPGDAFPTYPWWGYAAGAVVALAGYTVAILHSVGEL